MIICFSGTGNSRFVARRLAHRLGEEIYMLEHEALRDFSKVDIPDRRVVWVFPTYSWGIPPVVVNAMLQSHCTSADAKHHMVTTCGDDAGRIAVQWRRIMARKGYRAMHAASVIMPNTYTLMSGFDVDPETLADRKLLDAPARIDRIADVIAQGRAGDDIKAGSFAWFKSSVIYPWFVRHAMSPRPFGADPDRCTHCGLCVRECPCDNITPGADGGTPRWSDRCALCLRCYHICPSHAVYYGKKTHGKGQYTLDRALQSLKKQK